MKKITILLLVLLTISSVEARRKKRIPLDSFNYQIEAFGVGQEGKYAVKVFSQGKNVKRAKQAVARDGIHGVIFKGVNASKSGPSQPPLIENFDTCIKNHKDFFTSFFKDEDFKRFISQQSSEIIPGDCHRLHKGYEVGLTMVIDIKALRSYLEENNIIKPLW